MPQRSNRLLRWLSTVALIVLGLGIYLGYTLTAKPKPVASEATTFALTRSPVTPMAWPSYGQSALAVSGTNLLITNGDQTAHPIASIAKTILALALLKQKPLAATDTGPTITFTDADIQLYKTELAQNGSVVPIAAGETLTEVQALQALLLPSGNNIADSLAVWGFGSSDAYLTYANQMLTDMGLTNTHVADPSGFSPDTVSTAHDLVVLGQAILKDPALAAVVGLRETTLPVVGAVKNINSLLGTDDIIGIKTGNTDQAGGCLLFASQGTSNNGGATLVGAILGAPNLASVLHDTQKLLETNRGNFKPVTVVQAGQTVATYHTPWGATVTAVAAEDLTLYSPTGNAPTVQVNAPALTAPIASQVKVGTIKATTSDSTSEVPIKLKEAFSKPPLLWRITHPFAH